ncbi:MAG TPA: hypothetical protein VKR58_07255, partial [Aquella sp.]|nr:hypothetical protein [Aquella sp.]
MSWFNKNIYFETSAVNFMLDGLTREDAIATRALQTAKGNKYFLSPVTLWEIMITTDEIRRESMLFLCQHLFYKYLLKSPSEIFFDDLEGPVNYDNNETMLYSNSQIGRVWTAVCVDPLTKMEFDAKALKDGTSYI